MPKFGFDYFVKRQEVLSEMARPPKATLGAFTHQPEVGQRLLELQSKVEGIVKRGGLTDSEGNTIAGFPDSVRKNRILRYFIYMLSKMDEYEDEDYNFDDESVPEQGMSRRNEEIVSKAATALGIPPDKKWRNYKYPDFDKINIQLSDPDKLYKAGAIKLALDNPEYVMSDEFQAKVLNPENIGSYMSRGRVAQHSGYSINKASDLEELHGMSIEDIHAAQMDVKDTLTKINRAMMARRMMKNPKLAAKEPEKTGEMVNDFTINLDVILFVLDSLITKGNAIKKTVNNTVSKFSNPDEDTVNEVISDVADRYNLGFSYVYTLYKANIPTLETLKKSFEALSKVGINIDSFQSMMTKIKTTYSSMESVVDLIELLEFTVENILKGMAMTKKTEVEEFPGYPQDIIDKFLTTPEEKEKFRKFHNWYKVQLEKQLSDAENKMSALKWGAHAIPGEKEAVRRGYQAFLDKRPELKAKQEGTPQVESYIMGYMTEQISKDRFSPNGEFKDRGFKKPQNYSQWLMIND